MTESTLQQAMNALTRAERVIAGLTRPFLVLDRDLKVVAANPSFYRLFEASAAETETMAIFELGAGHWDAPDLRRQLDDVRQNGRAFHDFDVDRVFRPIGRRTLRLSGVPLAALDPADPELILLEIDDLTERNGPEEQIRWSEQRYRRLFESAQDGILILDRVTGVILDANPFIARLLGYGAEELKGKRLWQIGLFQDIEASEVAMAALTRTGYIRYDHLPLETTDGRRIDVEFVSNGYGEGRHQVIQCNIRDITERRKMEATVRAQVAALAETSRQKDEFLAMLSHELRNPLGALLNSVHLLRLDRNETPSQVAARGTIERQVSHLSRLVDDLLEISRATSGRIMLRPERVAVVDVVGRAVDTVRALFTRRRQDLSIEVPDRPIWVDADPTRLEQVLVNLLANASKYTDEDGRISLSVEADDTGVVLRIRDTGVGISSDLLPRIFDLFTQADRSLDRTQGGLGIGLTLVKRLVELHGGTVEASSAGLGQGSEFVVRFPAASPPPEEARPARAAPVMAGHSLRILVVDDSVDSAESLSRLLEATGNMVQVAHTGPAALTMASAFRPEVVLLDLGLPGMDGFEVARRLRGDPRLGAMLVVALTGYGQESDRRRSRAAGFDFHLLKPVDWGELKNLLATAAARD